MLVTLGRARIKWIKETTDKHRIHRPVSVEHPPVPVVQWREQKF